MYHITRAVNRSACALELRCITLAMQHHQFCFWSDSEWDERWEACGAGRVHLQVQDVSCIAELAPELTTIVRLHHQLKWFHGGTPTLCPAAAAPHATLLHRDCHRSQSALCYLPERPRNTMLKSAL